MAGGKSLRMGQDKGLMSWHGKEQRYHMVDLLSEFCDEVYISCREEQVNEIKDFPTLTDKFDVKGPAAGILTALHQDANCAWLVVACDLPLLDAAAIQYLIDNRDAGKVATTYKSPHDGLPEPLITIWEPNSKDALLSFVEQGYSCPRKALINSDTSIIVPKDEEALINANTPEEAERVRSIIDKRLNLA